MSSFAEGPPRTLAHTAGGRSTAWWGTILLIITEAVLFALLLTSYFYLWSNSGAWPQGEIEKPELLVSGIRTVLLLSSSVTIWLAERALRGDRRRGFAIWMWVTVALTAVFLAGHVEETLRTLEHFTLSTNAYGSLWYTVLNFHAAHLIVGLLMISYVLIRFSRGAYDSAEHTPVSTVGLYWHFVDVIWVAVYTSLYILPHVMTR